ncbi:hypothetical protein ACWDR5_21455 [Streptomyces koyangensis]
MLILPLASAVLALISDGLWGLTASAARTWSGRSPIGLGATVTVRADWSGVYARPNSSYRPRIAAPAAGPAVNTYTTTLVGAEREGAGRCTVTQHLEGDFPGGTVDLHYRFTLDQGLISRLDISP